MEDINHRVFGVLGVVWEPNPDEFRYAIRAFEGTATKRAVLAYITRTLDPIEWLLLAGTSCR